MWVKTAKMYILSGGGGMCRVNKALRHYLRVTGSLLIITGGLIEMVW